MRILILMFLAANASVTQSTRYASLKRASSTTHSIRTQSSGNLNDEGERSRIYLANIKGNRKCEISL